MKPYEIVIEAKNLLTSTTRRVEDKILSQSIKLKPEIISLASRVRDIMNQLSMIMDGLLNNINKDLDSNVLLSFNKYLYVSFYRDNFIIIRSKPYSIIVSYDRNDNKIYIKTRKLKAFIDGKTLEASYLAIKTSIEIDNIDDYKEKVSELKYILRKLSSIIEYNLAPIVSKRIRISSK